jgi:predicted GNAT family acetyltransferase
MVVRHEKLNHRGAFAIERDGRRLAELTYSVAPGGQVTLEHTVVDDELRGTGAGKHLVRAAVEWARSESRPLVPICPFARSVIEKTPEYRDVLA